MSQFIEAVLFAEFDIDKGSVLRQQYPEKVSDDEGLLAELMLPEGTHNHFQDWTIFMLNRPSSEPVQASKTPAPKQWPAHAYQYNTELDPPEWMLAAEAEVAATHWVSIDVPALQSGGVAQPPVIQIDLGGDKRHRLQHHEELQSLSNPDPNPSPNVHPDPHPHPHPHPNPNPNRNPNQELQYVALQPDFASMYSFDGEALGLHFRSGEQQKEFKAALDAAVTAASQPAEASVLWCLSHVSNRRDKTVRRGAQVKAL